MGKGASGIVLGLGLAFGPGHGISFHTIPTN